MIKFYRAFKTALLYIKRNFGLSFASVVVMTLSIFIVSVVGLAFFGSYKLVEYIDSKPALTIFLRGDLSDAQRTEFESLVKNTGYAREVTINDINFSKEDLTQKYPELEGTVTEENKTILPVIAFVYGSSQEDLKTLISRLENDQNFIANLIDKKNVDKVGWYKFNRDQADVIRDANRLLKNSGIAITAFLFVITSILIFITIRLTVNYHRKELEIMELVGAESWFIRLPFIIDGLIYGILGGVLSSGIIFLFKNFIIQRSQKFVPVLNSFFAEITWPTLSPFLMIQLIAAVIAIGALIGAASSFFAVIKYVNKK